MKATKLPSGMWRVSAYLGKDAQGKQIRKSFTGPDKRKVMRDASAFVDEHRSVVDASSSFGSVAKEFTALRESVLSPATMRGYKNITKQLEAKYSWFWNAKIYSIDSGDLQKLVDQLVSADMSPKTVRNYTGFISAVLRSKSIRMPLINMPQKIKPELAVPDIFTVKRTLEAARDNTELWICIMLAATGPLRRGEIAALSMEDIDFETNVIHVAHDMVMGTDKKWHVKAPKTTSSDRFIVMPGEVIDAIKMQGYVTKWTPKQIYNKFNWLLHKNEIPHYRFHDLRHFCVSYLKAKGHEDLYIAQRTGHSDYGTLRNVYAHTLQDHKKSVDKQILNDLKHFTA